MKLVTYSKYTYIRMFVNKFSAVLTNFHAPFYEVQIYFILFNIYYNFLQVILHPLSLPACALFECRNLVIVRPSNITFAPKPRIYYQNICILPIRCLWISKLLNFRTWNSPTFRRFQLSAILFAFLQTNLDRFFWKVPTSYYFQSYYIIKNIFSMGNRPHSQRNRRSGMRRCLHVFCGLYLGYPQNRQKSWTAAIVGAVSRDLSHEPHEKVLLK